MLVTAVGFLAFYALDKLTSLHVGHETASELDHDAATPPAHRHPRRQRDGHPQLPRRRGARGRRSRSAAGSGSIIAVVVIIHRFSDGIGVVSFLLASRMPSSTAWRWVLLVAVAPVAGVLLGSLS